MVEYACHLRRTSKVERSNEPTWAIFNIWKQGKHQKYPNVKNSSTCDIFIRLEHINNEELLNGQQFIHDFPLVASSSSCLLIWLEDILDKGLFYWQELREFLLQFGSIKLIVAPWGNYYLCLLLKSEVFPCEFGVNVIPIHFQNLIVTDHSRIRKVIDSSKVSLCHLNGNGKEFIQDRHGVWNVYYLLISSDLRDEVARVGQITWNGHSDAQCTNIFIIPEQIFYLSNISKTQNKP